FGGETNRNFSSKYEIESYVAYGTKDTDFKYSFGTSFRLNKETNTWLGGNYTNDIKEAAGLDFIAENSSFSPINPRNLNVSTFYNYKTISTYLKHDIQPNLEAKIQLSSGDYKPLFNYQFISPTKNLAKYKLTTASIGLQYNPKSEYMNSPIGKLTIRNEFPQFTFQLTKSFENILESDFDFTQINFRVLHKIKRLRKATTHILAEGGIVFGDAPISHLYNSTPNYTFKNPWRRRVTLAGTNSFETMGYNEFVSDRFVAIHLKHEITSFKITSKFKPQLTLVTRAAIGDIDNAAYQNGLEFKNLKKGYIESGLEFNSLFKGFGLSAFYRYGAYKNPEWSDNLALKLTYKLRLGF
ncbi:MAG: carboxypeptidase-like regulatory domain-containing protein, partial [Lutibacter sp.]|nr:carboxypeptidase-like regulatory domain-containing protein [Lutibacter sp.]